MLGHHHSVGPLRHNATDVLVADETLEPEAEPGLDAVGAHPGAWRSGTPLPHPALAEATRVLQHRYEVQFDGLGMIQYRNGSDGQAFHRDTDMRWLDDTVIAILTLGAQRPWQLRPRSARHTDAPGKGATHDLAPASGDLHVMGGRCQADWEHSVPYLGAQSTVGPRISIQWRFARR